VRCPFFEEKQSCGMAYGRGRSWRRSVWEGGGTVDLKGRTTPLTLTVKNTLAADHGFSIDSMKVIEVIKSGEEKTITVPLANIDKTVTDHRVYCQLHPKHVAATLKVTGN